MTPLADEIHRILVDEDGRPPLSVESLCRVLHATGYAGGQAGAGDIGAALAELLAAGQVELVWRRGAAHYRMIQAPAAVATGGTNRT